MNQPEKAAGLVAALVCCRGNRLAQFSAVTGFWLVWVSQDGGRALICTSSKQSSALFFSLERLLGLAELLS